MTTEKNLLSTKRFFNASPVDAFVNLELTGEKSFIKPDKTDNVVDLAQKFGEERNACMKFCIYGMIQSKWSDSDSVKIDFYIADSSTNINATDQQNLFWVYDKSTNVTATTWSVASRPLDNDGGKLSLNLYRKKKGSYFLPFELDLASLNKNQNGLNTNKSIFITISEPSKNAYLKQEIPFLYFDDEGALVEFGQETADILDDGTIIEINNNYPYLYDRHWLRSELTPNGPPYVSFVSRDSITIKEGGNDPRMADDKLFPIEVMLSEPSATGSERVNVEIVYGLDESKTPYTSVLVPSDLILQQDFVKWNYAGDSPLKYIYLKLFDDFFVEPVERITLRLTPVFGCIADPQKSQMLEIYIQDNDIPSYVSFENANIDFIEPRETDYKVSIPININLDKTVLVDDQYFDIYIDEQETDAKNTIGFSDPNSSSQGLVKSKRIFVNKTDLSYRVLLQYLPNSLYDKKRQIVLKMSGFTANLRPSSVTTGTDSKLVIYCEKNLDDNYCLINFPYNNAKGNSVVRNVFNVPQANYSIIEGQKTGSSYPTRMAYDWNTNIDGMATPNSKYGISTATTTTAQNNSSQPQKNIKTVVVEQQFSLEITNMGDTPVVLDYNVYNRGETLVIDINTGATFSTTSNVFAFDGDKFTLRLPANLVFIKSVALPIFPYTGGSYSVAHNQAMQNGTLTYTAATYGYLNCCYRIKIKNKSYNYLGDPIETRSDADKSAFYNTNLLTKTIYARQVDGAGNVSFNEDVIFRAGNQSSTKNFFVATELKGSYTRDVVPISGSTGTTLNYVSDTHYYNGVAILPDRGIVPLLANSGVTASRIFASDRKVIEVNQITRPVSGASTLGYNAVLPTSPYLIKYPLSASTFFCPFNFGTLLVQNGYGTVSYSPNGFTQPTVTTDAFVLSQSVAGSSSWNDNCIRQWSSANPNLRNQAVIEITNTGVIESYMPNGIILQPGERLAISELPVVPTNGTSGFYNLVRPLSPLTLPMSTNYGYDQNSGKFLKCKYRISFLNFPLYNSNGTFSNKVANNSFDFEDTVVQNISNTFQVKPRYLLTEYGEKVWIARGFATAVANCSNFSWSYMMQLSSTPNLNSAFIQGIVMTASNDSPLVQGYFLEFGDLPPSMPGKLNWRWQSCNGFSLY